MVVQMCIRDRLQDMKEIRPELILDEESHHRTYQSKETDGVKQVGLNPEYWGFFKLTDAQFDKLLELGDVYQRQHS